MDGNVISTVTIKIYDNRNMDVSFDRIDGIQAKQIDIMHRLLYRELTRMRAIERHKATSNSPPDKPQQPEGAQPPTPPTTPQKKYLNGGSQVAHKIPPVSSGFADMGVHVSQAEKDALAKSTTAPVIKK